MLPLPDLCPGGPADLRLFRRLRRLLIPGRLAGVPEGSLPNFQVQVIGQISIYAALIALAQFEGRRGHSGSSSLRVSHTLRGLVPR